MTSCTVDMSPIGSGIIGAAIFLAIGIALAGFFIAQAIASK